MTRLPKACDDGEKLKAEFPKGPLLGPVFSFMPNSSSSPSAALLQEIKSKAMDSIKICGISFNKTALYRFINVFIGLFTF